MLPRLLFGSGAPGPLAHGAPARLATWANANRAGWLFPAMLSALILDKMLLLVNHFLRFSCDCPTMTDSEPHAGATDDPPARAASAADALPTRLHLLIGRESVAAFARRCGLAESVLRTYLRDGRMPPLDKAAAIAAAAGVSLDWLAGGGATVAAEARARYGALGGPAAGDGVAIDAAVLAGIVQAVLEAWGGRGTPQQLAARIADLYQRTIERAPAVGPAASE